MSEGRKKEEQHKWELAPKELRLICYHFSSKNNNNISKWKMPATFQPWKNDSIATWKNIKVNWNTEMTIELSA